MPSAKVTSKGQITIPARNSQRAQPEARRSYQFSPKIGERRFVMIAKNRSITDLKGMLGKFDRVVTIEENERSNRQRRGGYS